MTGSVSIVGTNGALFYVTGVKLETGSVATPYNRQSLAKSMADCQRYYQVLGATGCIIAVGYNTAGASTYSPVPLPVIMRASPSVVYTGPTYGNASALVLGTAFANAITHQHTTTAAGYSYVQRTAQLSAEL